MQFPLLCFAWSTPFSAPCDPLSCEVVDDLKQFNNYEIHSLHYSAIVGGRQSGNIDTLQLQVSGYSPPAENHHGAAA